MPGTDGGRGESLRRLRLCVPRKPRDESAGAIHHVYARGNDRMAIFEDDRDRVAYLALLGDVVLRMGWRCLAYCLMPNHVHLLVETPEPNLGAGMCRLQGEYARRFNARHDRVGHLFERRYGSTRVKDDPQLWTVVAYIARNPVAAGLCDRPELWRWGSHTLMADETHGPAWLDVARLYAFLSGLVGGPGGDAYRRCVQSAHDAGHR